MKLRKGILTLSNCSKKSQLVLNKNNNADFVGLGGRDILGNSLAASPSSNIMVYCSMSDE